MLLVNQLNSSVDHHWPNPGTSDAPCTISSWALRRIASPTASPTAGRAGGSTSAWRRAFVEITWQIVGWSVGWLVGWLVEWIVWLAAWLEACRMVHIIMVDTGWLVWWNIQNGSLVAGGHSKQHNSRNRSGQWLLHIFYGIRTKHCDVNDESLAAPTNVRRFSAGSTLWGSSLRGQNQGQAWSRTQISWCCWPMWQPIWLWVKVLLGWSWPIAMCWPLTIISQPSKSISVRTNIDH